MKKLLAMFLALARVLSLAACGEPVTTTEAPKTTEAPTTEAPTTAPETTEAPTTAEPTTTAAPEPVVIASIQVMNPLLEGLEEVKDPNATRYNAYWLTGYAMKDIVEKNFWFDVADDAVLSAVSYVDMYAAEFGDLATMKEQGLCLNVPEGLQKNYHEGLMFGTGIKKDNTPYNLGWLVVGPEAIVLVNEDGYAATDLFEDLKMAEADSYDFVCGGPKPFTEEIDKADLEKVNIYFKDGRPVADSIAYAGYTLDDLLYIVPHGVEKDKTADVEVAEGTVYKITIANTAVTELEENFVGPFGGTVQTGFRVSDILKAAELENAKVDVQAVSLGDSATTTIPFDQFVERFIVPVDSKDRGAYTVGTNQEYGAVTINCGCYVLGENILLYVPESYTNEAGLPLADVLAKVGITECTAVNVICADGYSETIEAADLEGVCIFHNDGRIDTNSVAYPDYTLQDAVKIEVVK